MSGLGLVGGACKVLRVPCVGLDANALQSALMRSPHNLQNADVGAGNTLKLEPQEKVE